MSCSNRYLDILLHYLAVHFTGPVVVVVIEHDYFNILYYSGSLFSWNYSIKRNCISFVRHNLCWCSIKYRGMERKLTEVKSNKHFVFIFQLGEIILDHIFLLNYKHRVTRHLGFSLSNVSIKSLNRNDKSLQIPNGPLILPKCLSISYQ